MITDYLAAHHLLGNQDAVANALTLAIFIGILFGVLMGYLIAHGVHTSGAWERHFRADMARYEVRYHSFVEGMHHGRSRAFLTTMEVGAWD